MTIPKVSTEMRPIDLPSSDVSLPDAEAEFLGVSGVHCVDFAIAIGAAMIVMAIVTVLNIVTVLDIVAVLDIVTLLIVVAVS